MPVFNAVFYSLMGSKFQKELKKTPIFRPLFPAENYPQHRKSLRSTMRFLYKRTLFLKVK